MLKSVSIAQRVEGNQIAIPKFANRKQVVHIENIFMSNSITITGSTISVLPCATVTN